MIEGDSVPVGAIIDRPKTHLEVKRLPYGQIQTDSVV